ncbi:hypothetical protein AAIR98_001550 [Elusimicrobium simillimum]|uniref:alpha-2-macroglobulin n=1 Tax=Elusimicrobium simillimum TaxID=3143438 RepID=UPI003C705A49
MNKIVQNLKASIKKTPMVYAIILILVLIAASTVLKVILNSMPKTTKAPKPQPFTVSYTVSSLNPTRVYTDSDGKQTMGKPDNLYINFNADISFQSEKDNKNLAKISTTPALQGEWKWAGSRSLRFTPQKDWTANQKYTVKLPKEIVNTSEKENPLKLDKYEFTFNTPAFTRTIKSYRLYQDPTDPKIYKVLAELNFSYPVIPEEFEKTISLKLDKKDLAYEIVYDEFKRAASIVSVPVKITEAPQLAVLALSKLSTADAIEKTLDIPSSSKFFRLEGVSSDIVRDAKDDPQQVLFVNFTDAVSEDAIKGKVKAYLLPVTNKNKKNRKPADKQETETACVNLTQEDCDGENECTVGQQICRKIVAVGSYRSYDDWIPADITPAILAQLQEVKLEALPTSAKYDKLHTFRYHVPDNDSYYTRYLYVRVDAPLTSSSGFKIKDINSIITRLPSYPKEVKIVGAGSLLALSGSKQLSFVSRGVDGINVEIARVLPGKINHFVSQTGGNFQDPYFKNSYYFNENDISEMFMDFISINKSQNKADYSSLNMDKFLKTGKTGLFLIKAYGYNPKTQNTMTSSFNRFLLVTNLGLLTKKDIDGNIRTYVMNITTGAPVAGAQVEVIGRNGLPLFKKYTGEQGYVDFPSLGLFDDEKEPVAFVATLGGDVSFMPVDSYDRSVNYSRFDTSGVYYSSYKEKGLSAFLFTDRGIYRPGDSINIGAIVKTPDWKSLAGVPVKITVTDAKSKNIFERMVSLNAEGFADFTIATEPSSPTGTYYAYFYDVTNAKRPVSLGNTSFRVEEFQEDKLRITTQILGGDKKGWQPLEGLTAQVKLENLFGTPAAGNRIKADLSINPVGFYFNKYKDYTFNDPYRTVNAAPQSGKISLFDTTADEKGTVKKDINLKDYAGGTYRITLNAEGFEQESGASVYSSDAMLISPNRYLLGSKSTANLNYLKRDSKATVDFVAVDADLNQIELSKLKTKTIQVQYVSTLIKQYNGTYKYQSITKEVEVGTGTLNVSAKGAAVTLPTNEPGKYILEVYDEFNQKLSKVNFFVAGSANLTYSLEKDAELLVTIEREEVEPGSDITLNIITPYTGSGLITIEREKVFAQKWFTTTSTSSQQSIRVPADFEGNGYVNISFIRDIDSKEIFAAPHSYAVIPFYVTRNKRIVKINLDAPTLVKPGDELEVKYSTDKPSKIVVYGVNEGILQVAGYRLPQPLNHFFKKMALEVKTRQIIDLILPDFKMVKAISATGGDDEELAYSKEMLDTGLNPFARKRDKPVVFWSGVMTADSTTRTYKYKVPSYFNGELKVMAVAASSGAAGAASTATVSRAPVILMPGNPFTAAPGDVFDANIRVSNNKKDSADGKITIALSVSKHLEILGDKMLDLTIPYGSSETVRFKVRALDNLGSATLTYTATHQNPKDIISADATLSVRPASVYATVLKTDNVTKTPSQINNFQRDMYDFGAERNIYISNSPLVVAKGLANYFRQYPHGCTEQITSQVFPFLALAQNNIVDRKATEQSFAIVQERLKKRQLNYGGFGVWDTSNSENQTVTIYTMHMLTDAKALGYNVDANLLSKGLSRLDDYASKYPTSAANAEAIAYSNYLLARNGKVVTNYLLRTEEYLGKNQKNWQETLTGAYIAASYALLKDEAKAKNIINSFKPEGTKYIFYSDYDSSSIRNAKYMYLVGKHFPELLSKNSGIIKALVSAVIENNYNTLSGANTIMALTAYSEATADNDAKIKLSGVTGKEKENIALTKDGFPKADLNAKINALTIEDSELGPLGLYYILTTQGFDKKPADESLSKGLDIVREYLDEQGNPAKDITVGQDITVSIKIKTSGTTEYASNIAITDLLPGAFEIVSGSLTGNTDYYDIREDRALIYTSANKNISEIRYKVKVIASGDYTVPMLHAVAMYDKEIYGNVAAGKLTVKPAN